MAELLDEIQAYFSHCTQNEWIAWGVNTLGLLLFIVGITLFFL